MRSMSSCLNLYKDVIYEYVGIYIYIYIYIYIERERERERDVDTCVFILYVLCRNFNSYFRRRDEEIDK